MTDSSGCNASLPGFGFCWNRTHFPAGKKKKYIDDFICHRQAWITVFIFVYLALHSPCTLSTYEVSRDNERMKQVGYGQTVSTGLSKKQR